MNGMMRGTAFLRAVGRLKPNISVEQARAALAVLGDSYRTQYPEKIDAKIGDGFQAVARSGDGESPAGLSPRC